MYHADSSSFELAISFLLLHIALVTSGATPRQAALVCSDFQRPNRHVNDPLCRARTRAPTGRVVSCNRASVNPANAKWRICRALSVCMG